MSEEQRKKVYEAMLRELEEEEKRKISKKRKGKTLRYCQHCADRNMGIYIDYRLRCYYCNTPMREATPEEEKAHKRRVKMWAKEDAEHRKEEREWAKKAKKR